MNDDRRQELQKIAREQILYHLRSDLEGRSEHIMKEAWEQCGGEADELAVMDDELRAIVGLIEERAAVSADGRRPE